MILRVIILWQQSKLGLDTNFRWMDNERVNASDLITEELLPIAREGLEKASVNSSDITNYLDIIRAGVDKGQTGAYWMVSNYAALMKDDNPKEQTLAAITTAMIKNQKKGEPGT